MLLRNQIKFCYYFVFRETKNLYTLATIPQ
jgi:hypothetical protein